MVCLIYVGSTSCYMYAYRPHIITSGNSSDDHLSIESDELNTPYFSANSTYGNTAYISCIGTQLDEDPLDRKHSFFQLYD